MLNTMTPDLARPWVRWEGPLTCNAPVLTTALAALSAMDFARIERLAGPRPSCGGRVDPETWRCTECRSLAEHATYPGTCDLCGRPCVIVRYRHEARANCHCHIPASVRARLDAEEEARREKLQIERELQQARRKQDADLALAREEAEDCLASRDGHCDEHRPPRHPYAYCTSCQWNLRR